MLGGRASRAARRGAGGLVPRSAAVLNAASTAGSDASTIVAVQAHCFNLLYPNEAYGDADASVAEDADARRDQWRKFMLRYKRLSSIHADIAKHISLRSHAAFRYTKEEASFQRALKLMPDVYASAVGTTVLQLKEIPPRPKEFDGALCLFNLAEGTNEIVLRAALSDFGEVTSVELSHNPVVVRFASHEAAVAAKRAGATKFYDGVDTLYNERSYDGRRGDPDNRGDDDGRGW